MVFYDFKKAATPSRTDSDAVEFAEWVREISFDYAVYTDGKKAWWSDDDQKSYTTAELYSIFLKTKKQ